MGSSDEDDYMSDNFLVKKVDDVKPGIRKTVAQKRKFMIERNRFENEEVQRTRKTRHELETETRDEALAIPLHHSDSGNLGLKLMHKMGYKQGMTLGKSSHAITEPIGIQLKSGRTGLGHETEKKRKAEDLIKAHQNWMINRSRINDQLSHEFIDRKRSHALQREIQYELYKCQKACYDLDNKQGLKEPAQVFYWPNYEETVEESGESKVDEPSSNKNLASFVNSGINADKTLEKLESHDKTPERLESHDKTPEKLESHDKTPEKLESHDKTPEKLESHDKTPERLEAHEKIPEEKPVVFLLDEETPKLDPNLLDPSTKLFSLNMYLRDNYYFCPWCAIVFENEDDMGNNCPGLSKQEHDDEAM